MKIYYYFCEKILIFQKIISTMNNNKYLTKTLVATAWFLVFNAVATWAQCVIPITDDQPYIEGFESDGFDCWTVETVGGGNWTTLLGATTVASFSGQNMGDEARLISPIFDMSEVNAAMFTFSYAMMGLMQSDELEVSYRSSESDSWHVLGSFSFSDFNSFYEETYELENLSSTYQISFLGRFMGGLYVFVDNIEIVSSISCARPVGLHVSEITASSALLDWSSNGNEENWTIELNGMEITVEARPYLMEELRPQMTYSFRVRANCGDGLLSEWATPVSFTTLCDVIFVTDEVPYRDDFEASDGFLCWQNEIVSGVDSWVVDPGYLIHNNTAFFIWLGGQARLVSAPLDITTVTRPALDFKHKQPKEQNSVDELSVLYRTSEAEAWVLLKKYSSAAGSWLSETIELPNPSATYQIAFMATANGAGGIYVDDVAVGAMEVVGVAKQSANEFVVSPNPTHGCVTIETQTEARKVVVFDMFGKQLLTETVVEGRATLDLSTYAKGVYMVRVVGDSGTKTVRIVKD